MREPTPVITWNTSSAVTPAGTVKVMFDVAHVDDGGKVAMSGYENVPLAIFCSRVSVLGIFDIYVSENVY